VGEICSPAIAENVRDDPAGLPDGSFVAQQMNALAVIIA
jgi:hypothetical protein